MGLAEIQAALARLYIDPGLRDRFFADPATDHVHVHNATRGCWAVRVDRAGSFANTG